MSILDWLTRLGILKVGATSAVYTSAKDRPASFTDDNLGEAGAGTADTGMPATDPAPAADTSPSGSTDR